VQWDIQSAAQSHVAERDEIGNWAGDSPLLPAIGIATPSRDGHPRFYVNATAAEGGGTYARQISVWEWNGREALPLFIKTFPASVETGADDLRPGLLTLHTKGTFKTFFSCGTCAEPEMLWRIEITPDGIRHLDAKDLVPELRQCRSASCDCGSKTATSLSATTARPEIDCFPAPPLRRGFRPAGPLRQ
jgi:hypothetical protein